MPGIILACTHQIFISHQRRLKVSLFPSQPMESSSLGDRSSSLGSCACCLKALGTKADTAKDTAENCLWFSAPFPAHFTARIWESPVVRSGTGRTFCSQISNPKQLQTHPKHSLLTKSGATQIPYDAGTSRYLESSGMDKLKDLGVWASPETSSDTCQSHGEHSHEFSVLGISLSLCIFEDLPMATSVCGSFVSLLLI